MASDAAAAAAREPIAIIGSGCRFPGQANNTSKLWELLRKPRDLLRAIPKDRFSSEGFYHPNPAYHGSSATKQAYFLDENVRLFDAPFFGVSAEQASAIDPQQRILLEVVYEYVCSISFAAIKFMANTSFSRLTELLKLQESVSKTSGEAILLCM